MAVYGRAPLTYNDEMLELSRKLKCSSRHSTAKNVFDWIIENITYNNYAKGIIRRIFLNYEYKSAHQVFRTCEGICLDQAYLYVVLARYAGVSSDVVEVRRDNKGKKVWHACCSVNAEDERLLVDTAYNQFGIKHEDYTIMPDEDVRKEYYSIRHCYEDEIVEKPIVYDEPAPYIPPAVVIPDYVDIKPVYYVPDHVKPVFKIPSTVNSGRNATVMPIIKIDVNIMKIDIVFTGTNPLNCDVKKDYNEILKDKTEISGFYFERKKDYTNLNKFLKDYLEEKDD